MSFFLLKSAFLVPAAPGVCTSFHFHTTLPFPAPLLGWDFAKTQSQSQGFCIFLAPCGNSSRPCLSRPCGWEETGARKQPRPSADRNSPHHPQPTTQSPQPGQTSRIGKFHLGETDKSGQGGEKSGIRNEAWSGLAERNIYVAPSEEFLHRERGSSALL